MRLSEPTSDLPSPQPESLSKDPQGETLVERNPAEELSNSNEFEEMMRYSTNAIYRKGYADARHDLLAAIRARALALEGSLIDISAVMFSLNVPGEGLAASESNELAPVSGNHKSREPEHRTHPGPSLYIHSGKTCNITNRLHQNLLNLHNCETIVGWKGHGMKNQEWTLLWRDGSCAFRSVTNGKYLATEANRREPGARLTSVDYELYGWVVEPWIEKGYYQLFWQRTNLVWDLGNSLNDQPVELWGKSGAEHQVWQFEEV